MDSSRSLDTKILEIIKTLIKQSTFLEFDHENLKKICEFTLLSFLPCYKPIEHFSKVAKRKHLESIDSLDKTSVSRKTSSIDHLEFVGPQTSRNASSKKLTLSANVSIPTNQFALQINVSIFNIIHKFETIVSLKRLEILQIKFVEFLISIHEFPQTYVPLKSVVHLMQAKSLVQVVTEDNKSLTKYLCKLLSLSIMSTDNKKTLTSYEDFPLVLKSYCNESHLYSYIFLAIMRKMKWDIHEVEMPFDKNEKLLPNFLKIDDIILLNYLLNSLFNSLSNLKNTLKYIQNSESLKDMCQTILKNMGPQENKRFSLMYPKKNDDEMLFRGGIVENDDDLISSEFLNVQQNRPFLSSFDEINEKNTNNNYNNNRKNVNKLLDLEENNSNSPNQFNNESKIEENSLVNNNSSFDNEGTSQMLRIFNVSPIKPLSAALKTSITKPRAPSMFPKKKLTFFRILKWMMALKKILKPKF